MLHGGSKSVLAGSQILLRSLSSRDEVELRVSENNEDLVSFVGPSWYRTVTVHYRALGRFVTLSYDRVYVLFL